MTTSIDRPAAVIPRPTSIGQATAVEQARAVAEVAAAVQVAQQFPRDLDRVRREMTIACGSLQLAREAFYAVPNRGQGPSVHLARELAAIYGNFQSGVHELRRDDAAAESEVQAFAWDVERNTRQSRTFIHPHARMKAGRREALTDLQDIYLSNQNTGARALRECIFAALPKWLVREAEALCRATLEKGDGRSVAERADAAVNAFGQLAVTEPQLIAYLGRKRAEWTPQDLAALEVIIMSIRRGESKPDEHFPTQREPERRVTAAEIAAQQAASPATDDSAPATTDDPEPEPEPAASTSRQPLITQAQSKKLHAILGQLAVTDRDEKLKVLSALILRRVISSTELTRDEAKVIIDTLESVSQREDPTGNLAFIVEAAEAQLAGGDS